MTTTFDGNDDLYQTWLAGHPRVCHQYAAAHLARLPGFAPRQLRFHQPVYGNGATTVEELRGWATKHGRSDGSFSNEGCFCNRPAA